MLLDGKVFAFMIIIVMMIAYFAYHQYGTNKEHMRTIKKLTKSNERLTKRFDHSKYGVAEEDD